MKKMKFISLVFILFFMVSDLYQMKTDAAAADKTETGIVFENGKSTTPTTPSYEPVNIDKSTIKKGGYLPQTGELAQPITLFLLGCLMVTVIFFITKVRKEINGGENY